MDNPKKILLIEDELFIRDLYVRILSQAGFEVITAEDGLAGLALAQTKPALILLDIMLPKLNGIEVLERLKVQEATKNIPVVLLTNLGQSNIIKHAFDLGAQGYLQKMITNPAELVKNVNDFLTNPNLQMDFEHLKLD